LYISELESILGEQLEKTTPAIVRGSTGHAIGGVLPFGNIKQLPTWMDSALLLHKYIWVSAGIAESAFEMRPKELARITSATLIDI